MGIIKNFTNNGVPKGNIFEYPQGQKPLITKKIPTKLTDEPDNAKGLDFQVTRRASDLARITKLLTTTPQGIKFSANQTLLRQDLRLSSDKIQAIKDNFNRLVQDRKEKKSLRDRINSAGQALGLQSLKLKDIVLPGPPRGNLKDLIKKARDKVIDEVVKTSSIIATTLAQVPVNGTGTHFIQGQEPVGKNIGYIPGKPHVDAINGTPIGNTEGLAKYRDEQNPPQSLQDLTGNEDLGNENSIYTPYYKGSSLSGIDLNTTDGVNSSGGLSTQQVRNSKGQLVSLNIEKRINTGNQGLNPANSNLSERVDALNFLDPGPKVDGTLSSDDIAYGNIAKSGRDIVKFRINVVTPQGDSTTGAKENYLYFRAFIDSFSDNYSSEWDEFRYVGRGDKMYNYRGLDRGMEVNFKIAAMTAVEMKPLYKKINYLASTVAPTYNGNFMRGTLVKLTIGDYIDEQPGFIRSVNYSWEDGLPWEIAMLEPEERDSTIGRDKGMKELPMVLNCQLSFQPIHQFVPATGQGSQYILNNSDDKAWHI